MNETSQGHEAYLLRDWQDLPPAHGRLWADHDHATWPNLTYGYGQVRSICPAAIGYTLVGENQAIGVAAWVVGSNYDKLMNKPIDSEEEDTGKPGTSNGSTDAPLDSLDYGGIGYS